MKWALFIGMVVGGAVGNGPVPMAFSEEPTAVLSPKPVTVYEVRGVFKGFDAKTRQATISHEKIPGYMEAMTMSFEVRDDAELSGVKAGDAVEFRLCVKADDAWIDHVRKTGFGEAPLLVPAKTAGPGRELNVGDRLPDIALVNERGELIRLESFRGEVLAITFIYTACPLPTYCLRMSRNFKVAQELLGQLAPGRGWHFLSISFDAQRDRPEILAAYAKAYQADSKLWTFASASEAAVHAVGDGIGLEFKRTEGRIDHNLRTVVIDGQGRIRCILRGNSWTPQELAAQMHSALRGR